MKNQPILNRSLSNLAEQWARPDREFFFPCLFWSKYSFKLVQVQDIHPSLFRSKMFLTFTLILSPNPNINPNFNPDHNSWTETSVEKNLRLASLTFLVAIYTCDDRMEKKRTDVLVNRVRAFVVYVIYR